MMVPPTRALFCWLGASRVPGPEKAGRAILRWALAFIPETMGPPPGLQHLTEAGNGNIGGPRPPAWSPRCVLAAAVLISFCILPCGSRD